MKRILFIVFLLSSTKFFAQQIKFDAEEYNFGIIKQGESITYEFNYINTSDIPLTLSSVTAPCDCISTNWSKESLGKNQTASIKIIFNAADKLGQQDKIVVVLSNSASRGANILHIKGEISLTAMKNSPVFSDTVTNKSTTTTTYNEPASKSEKPVPKQINLPVFNDIIDIISMMGKTYWSLGVTYAKIDKAPIRPEAVISDIHTFTNNHELGYDIEKSYLLKYKESIDSTFNNMKLIGNSLGQFVYSKNLEIPIRFCTYKDVSKLCFITGIAVDNVYNTLRLTSRQRAGKVVTEFIIPSIKSMNPILDKEFDFIGLGAIYGSKDLSDKYGLIKEEYIAFIVSCKKARDFITGKITEDELVESADIISSDRDMVIGTKRIKIILE